jgi:hypothetical protein
MATKFLDRSPQSVDPLSWYLGPLVPLVFGSLIVVYGSILSVATSRHTGSLALQLIAVALCSSACVLLHVATRPKRAPLGWGVAILVILIALCGLQLSVMRYDGSALPIVQWWAPAGVALVIGSLAPYLSVRRVVVLGLGASVAAGALGAGIFLRDLEVWSAPDIVIMLMTAPLASVAASVTFIVTVVGTTQRLLGERPPAPVPRDEVEEDAASAVQQGTLARITARAAPFLQRMAETGTVTAADRALAGQLARRVRDDLVLQAAASWLDSVASERRMVVIDPERRADGMNDAQKTALTGLIDAILSTDAGSNSLLVELRGEDNGSTAVGISMDLELPEGRRTMHLAPYYLTLKATVVGLTWNDGRLLRMRFEVPSEDPRE